MTTRSKHISGIKIKQIIDLSQSFSSTAEKILFLQKTIRNQAVGGLIYSGALKALSSGPAPAIQRQNAPTGTGASWWDPATGLPRQNEYKGEDQVTQAQKDLHTQIMVIRNGYEDRTTAPKGKPKLSKSGKGQQYGGNVGNRKTPTDLDPTSRIQKLTWEELGSEGSTSAINTWDTMVFSYGSGFAWGGGTGKLNSMLDKLSNIDPAALDELAQAGFKYSAGGSYLYVDRDTTCILEGRPGLEKMRNDTQMLSVLIDVAESGQHAQAYSDAQFTVMRNTMSVINPDDVKAWSDMAVRLVIHIMWAGKNWARYKSTNGDVSAIAAQLVSDFGARKRDQQGDAIILSEGGMAWVYLKSANSLIAKTLGAPDTKDLNIGINPAPALPGDITTPHAYNGHVFFGFKGGFYHILLSGAAQPPVKPPEQQPLVPPQETPPEGTGPTEEDIERKARQITTEIFRRRHPEMGNVDIWHLAVDQERQLIDEREQIYKNEALPLARQRP